MESMLNTIWLIITALAFGGVVEKAGGHRTADNTGHQSGEVHRLPGRLPVGAVIATNIVTADQYIAIVLPGWMFKSAFDIAGSLPWCGPRTIGASGTPTGALVPWNSCGAFLAATLGVPTLSFLPYAVFNFASPLLAIAFAYLGLRMMRAPATPQRSVGGKGTANGDDGVASVGSVLRAGTEHLRFLLSSRPWITARLR